MSETTLPSMRVDGQVALVTGAGRGIGRGCAIALAEAGAEVIAMSRTEAELKEVVAEIQDAGGTATPVVCDVSDGAAVRERISEIQKLDILVNNAGILRASSLLELSEEDLDAMLQINCRGAVLVAQAAVQIMERQGSGVVINMSSTFGVNGRANNLSLIHISEPTRPY